MAVGRFSLREKSREEKLYLANVAHKIAQAGRSSANSNCQRCVVLLEVVEPAMSQVGCIGQHFAKRHSGFRGAAFFHCRSVRVTRWSFNEPVMLSQEITDVRAGGKPR